MKSLCGQLYTSKVTVCGLLLRFFFLCKVAMWTAFEKFLIAMPVVSVRMGTNTQKPFCFLNFCSPSSFFFLISATHARGLCARGHKFTKALSIVAEIRKKTKLRRWLLRISARHAGGLDQYVIELVPLRHDPLLYVYVFVYIYIYVDIYVCVCVYIYIYIFIYI